MSEVTLNLHLDGRACGMKEVQVPMNMLTAGFRLESSACPTARLTEALILQAMENGNVAWSIHHLSNPDHLLLLGSGSQQAPTPMQVPTTLPLCI